MQLQSTKTSRSIMWNQKLKTVSVTFWLPWKPMKSLHCTLLLDILLISYSQKHKLGNSKFRAVLTVVTSWCFWVFFVLSNELYPFFFKNSDMQCYDKMTRIFIGTRKCKCMHVQGGINAVTVQIKATAFGHAHHNVMIVRLRFAVHLSWRKVARGIPRCHFQNYQN